MPGTASSARRSATWTVTVTQGQAYVATVGRGGWAYVATVGRGGWAYVATVGRGGWVMAETVPCEH